MQQAYKDLLDFPLALYLCAFQAPGTYFLYSTMYEVRQLVPCRSNPEKCQFPMNFTELLDFDPGFPLAEAEWEGKKCTRQFSNMAVSVNIEDSTSAKWTGRN